MIIEVIEYDAELQLQKRHCTKYRIQPMILNEVNRTL